MLVAGSKTFINSGTIDIIDTNEIVAITEGSQQVKQVCRVTLSNVTEPVEVDSEEFESLFSPSEDVRWHNLLLHQLTWSSLMCLNQVVTIHPDHLLFLYLHHW